MTIRAFLLGGATIAAILTSEGAAYAQAVAVGPDAAASANAPAAEEIIVTGSRIRRDPLSQESRRSSSSTGGDRANRPVVDRRRAATPAQRQRRPELEGQQQRQHRQSARWRRRRRRARPRSTCATSSAKRTLVLVDGIRFVPAPAPAASRRRSTSTRSPTSQIERIEVLESGQSPLYGSDALAGVVNIITKSTQEGLQASAQFGTFRQGDGHTQDYEASYGIKLPTTSIVFGGSYVKQEAVKTANRSTVAVSQPVPDELHRPDRRVQQRDARTAASCFNAGNPADPAGGSLTLKPYPDHWPAGVQPADPTGATSDFKAFTSADRFNFAPFNYYLTPSERYGGLDQHQAGARRYRQLRVKAAYNRRNSQNQAAFLPLFIGPDAGNGNLLDTITIDATNPYNPFGTLSAGGAGNPPANYSFIARRLVEAGQRTYTQHVDTMSGTATLDGSFHIGEHKWFWDVNASFGSERRPPDLHRQHQRRQARAGARPGRAVHRAVRAVRHLRRRGLGDAGDARLRRLHRARPQPAGAVRLYRQPVGRPVRPAGRRRSASPSATSTAISSAASIPIRSSSPASAPTSRHSRRSGHYRPTRSTAKSAFRSSRTSPFF